MLTEPTTPLTRVKRGTLKILLGAAPGAGEVQVTVQFDTPNAGALAATEAAVRGVPGVRSATTTSLALGGVSLMRVLYDGDPGALIGALQARGFQVSGAGQSIRIRRAAPAPAVPTAPAPATVPPAG